MAAISRVIVGASVTVQSAFTDVNGLAADPTGSPEVTLSVLDPAGSTTTGTYNPNVGSYTFTHVGAGVFSAPITPTLTGLYRWTMTGTVSGFGCVTRGSFTVNAATDYPCEYGYCDLTDIMARVAAAQWNPLDPAQSADAYPTVTQVNDWITQASHQIDSALLRRGYTVPIVPQTSATIAAQAWTLLQTCSAELVTGWVENTRGTQDAKGEAVGEWHLKYGDDLLERLENGDDNLTIMGVAGTFEPEADPAGAMDTNMNDSDPITSLMPSPIFSVVPMQSVGFPQENNGFDPLTTW